MTAAKPSIRTRIRELRCALSAEERRQAAEALVARALGIPGLADARLVLGYWPTAEEIDPRPLMDALAARGAALALPRVDEPGRLTLHPFGAADELVAGSFGILEPAADAPAFDAREVDAVLVPGVAFDERAHRIGYGGGFYDRLLARLRPDALTVGLAFDCQVLAEPLPAEEHDVALRALATPTRTAFLG